MKPFVQKQNPSPTRWLAFIGAVAAGFGLWYFELIPELRPVPSGQLASDAESGVPSLPETWDEIVDHTDGSAAPSVDDEQTSVNHLMNEADPLDQVLGDLSEPEIPAVSSGPVQPVSGTNDSAGAAVQPASFRRGPEAADGGDEGSGVVPAVASAVTADLVLSAETAEELRSADLLLRQSRIVEAHNKLSTLYWQQPESRAVFLDQLQSVAAEIFEDPHRHVGAAYLVMPGDTLESIGQKHQVPWQYLSRLNRISPRELQAGQEIKVMRGPFSAVVDLSRFELTVHAHGYFMKRYDVGIGEGNRTPIGEFTVQEKLENPTWYNPDGGQIDKDDPQNPLGEYWIGLGDHIGIHGTIDAQSIGSARSRGCVHMKDDDIAEVFGLLGHGSSVRIRP